MLELTAADVSRLSPLFRGRTASLAGVLLGCDVVDERHDRLGRIVALFVERGEIVAFRLELDAELGAPPATRVEVKLDDVVDVEPGRVVLASTAADVLAA